MRNVLNFLIRYNSWLLLALYLVLGCMLLFNFNNYQQSVWLTSTNRVSAMLNGVYGNIQSYTGLRKANALLEQRNALLQARSGIWKMSSEPPASSSPTPRPPFPSQSASATSRPQ